jgi:histidinol-phosphate aminotransferase
MAAAVAHNSRWLPWVSERINAMGLEAIPGVGNFVLVRFPGDRCSAADAYLTSRGFILRAVAAYGLPDCLRMTIGTEAANRGVIEALSALMKDCGRG